jgi:serine/threonine-protein phosphatase 6 regulatory subunit 3
MLRNLGFRGLHKKKSVLNGNIDKMINENNDISLEEILAEDTIIDEVENQNKTLMKYLKKDKIKQMIDYIIKEPPNDASQDKGYKFPWICSQIFNLGDSNIMKYFLKTNKELEEEKKKEEERENNKNEQSSENSKTDDDKNKKNKKININEIVRQKGKENKIELLDYLLTFLSSDSEPNYVLCGYFASIIKTLLNMDQTLIIKYLYVENKEFIRKLIYHSYRQSISEILNKIVQYDSNEEEFNIEDMALIRMDILEGLFDKIDANMDNEKLDSISTLIKSISTDEKLLSDMLNNKKIIECLVTRPLRNINLVSKDNINDEFIINKRRNFDILIDIIINWINSINSFDIDIPSTDGSDDENENENENEKNNINYKHTILSYELFKVLGNLIKVNFNKNDEIESNENKILQCFDEKFLVPLGLFRIKIVELLGNLFTYFKNIPQLYDKLLIDCQFFENAFKYLFEYELNNIYQDALLSLFKKFLNYSDKHPLLAEFLFEKLNLIDLIISKLKDTEISQKSETPEDISKKDRFLYQSGNTTSRGYIAFLISLSYKINTIIGGEPLRINNTLSREGSISFITRTAPFVGKEEINEFYGMEEDELYEAVSHESNEKTSKLNCAVKSMEKYLNDKWNDFFYDHIADKIRLYETKLYKDDRRDSIFHNPFVLENDDENLENNRQNNFGLGEDEDEDVLGKQMRKSKNRPDFEKILYGDENDADMDINLNNRFKMSMRLPRSNKNNNNNNMKVGGKRGSWGSKPAKVVVDEIDDIVDNKNKNEENNNEEEENPLDKFNKENKNENEEEENPLDKLRRGTKNNNKDENPLDKFRNNKNNDDNLYDDEEEENPLDKFRRENDNGNDEDENPLDKLKKFKTNNKENDNPLDKFKDNGINIYEDEEEEENPLDKFKRENKK